MLSYGAVILLLILSTFTPILAALYLLLIATTVLLRAAGSVYHIFSGTKKVELAQSIDWSMALADLESPSDGSTRLFTGSFGAHHKQNLQRIADSPASYPKPSEVYNAVIIATYNEPYEVLKDTITTVAESTYDNQHIILVLAYEERGGKHTKASAERLESEFADVFFEFKSVMHPANMPKEVVGKGGNITFAGRFLASWVAKKRLKPENVLVTTLDSDNRPHKCYFDYVAYEFIIHENRTNLSFQPVSLFLNNIWDVPAPMRVVATGNSFWNIVTSVRPHTLRNFASHAQPLDALIAMDFWSTRTIVEDGHQYWRSYFFFKGNYDVISIFVPIYQDAVMSKTYVTTLKAQFVQLRRWAYGASDVPYVATRIFSKHRTVPFWGGISRLARLIDSHVTLASIPLIITFGGWVPLFLNTEAARSVVANQLPEIVGFLQRIATVGLVIMVFLSLKMLPPRPSRYKRHRTVGMVLQWFLMPITALIYSSAAAYNSQTRLLLGKYLTIFDVTEKATAVSVQLEKERQRRHKLLSILSKTK